MTLGLRLLRGYVGTSTVPTPFDVSQTGFWNNIAEPRATYYNGTTYFGYNDAPGAMYVSSYNHAARTFTTPFQLVSGWTTPDGNVHNSIAILPRASDHKLLTVYCKELDAHAYARISTNAEDATAWGAATAILPSGAWQYPQLYQLASGTIYLFMKARPSSTSYTSVCTSTDGGATWSGVTNLIGPRTTPQTFWRTYSDGGTLFHIFTTDTDRTPSSPCALYHFIFDGTTLYKSDMTPISGPYPVTADSGTLIQDASLGSAWSEGGSISPSGTVGTVILIYDNANAKDLLRAAHWTGSAWSVSSTITDSGGTIGGNKFVAGACIDKKDPFTIYANRKSGSHFELFRYRSLDSGSTWLETAITSGSSADNATPDTPYNAAAGFQIVWGLGTFTDSFTYSFDVYGART